jgi:hypothetical protein
MDVIKEVVRSTMIRRIESWPDGVSGYLSFDNMADCTCDFCYPRHLCERCLCCEYTALGIDAFIVRYPGLGIEHGCPSTTLSTLTGLSFSGSLHLLCDHLGVAFFQLLHTKAGRRAVRRRFVSNWEAIWAELTSQRLLDLRELRVEAEAVAV